MGDEVMSIVAEAAPPATCAPPESEDRYRALFDSALDLIYELSPEGQLLAANQPGLDALGYDRTDVAQLWIFDVLDVKDLDRALNLISEVTAAGRALHLEEFTLRRKDGKRVVIETNGVLFKKEGKPCSILVVARDITVRRDLEARLRASEQMCAVGQLASETAHDFNNQLNTILGNTELIGERVAGDPRLTKYVDNIFTAIRNAGNLTSRLLALALRGETLSIPVHVHDVIAEVISLLQYNVADGLRILSDLSAEPLVASADPATLQHALLSLAFNACDAMPNGGELRFSTAAVALSIDDLKNRLSTIEPGPYIRIDVTDTGVGMDEATMARVFEPCYTTKSPDLHTGMGLATVNRSLAPHSGVIDVASQLRAGTTFSIYLPLNDPGAWMRDLSQASDEVVPGQGRIFLVDDDEMICDITSEQLRRLGYEVDVFHQCPEAIDSYRRVWSEVRLVILDMSMPVLSGTDAFHAVRAVNPQARVLFMSGYSHTDRIEELIRGGRADFIEKPFRKALLSRKIAALLSG